MKFKAITIGFIFFMLSACTVQKVIRIDILKPAAQSIPSDVKKVLFAVKPEEIKTYYFYNEEDSSFNIKLNYSGLLIDTIYKAMQNINKEVGKYSFNGIIYYEDEMGLRNCRDFADANNVDGIIILEKLKFYVIQTPYDKTGPGTNIEYLNMIGYGLNWKYYDNNRLKFSDSYTMEDNWEDSGNLATKSNPEKELKPIASYIGDFTGKKYIKRISPYWTTVSREIVIAPNTGFKKALEHINNNNPDSAIIEFQKYYNCGSKKIKAYALYNAAICYEMKDELQFADELLDIAMLEKNKKLFRTYSSILFERILERKRLFNQVDW